MCSVAISLVVSAGESPVEGILTGCFSYVLYVSRTSARLCSRMRLLLDVMMVEWWGRQWQWQCEGDRLKSKEAAAIGRLAHGSVR